jgi:hypothetical protein
MGCNPIPLELAEGYRAVRGVWRAHPVSGDLRPSDGMKADVVVVGRP